MSSSGARKRRATSAGSGVGEPDPEPLAEEAVAGLLPEALRLVEQVAALGGETVEIEAESLVELVVVGGPEPADGLTVDSGRLEVDRVQLLVEQRQPCTLEALAPVAVGLVRHHDAHHPVRDLLAVDGRLERRLDLRELLLV